jgi:OOP family OmpA-OmpF porin
VEAVVAPKVEEPIAPAAPVKVVLDSDHDGVPDYLDKCPGTPSGMAVDKDGCPPDSDKDGVPDYLDKCPDTPVGVAVDKDGCSDKQRQDAQTKVPDKVFIALNLKFDTGKAVVKKKYYKSVKKVADFMKAHPETKVVIYGHTDNVGKKAFNARLSKARAESVRKCLIYNFGIKASRVTAVGYGLNKPMASNDTKKGRQKNRRIEAAIEAIQIK